MVRAKKVKKWKTLTEAYNSIKYHPIEDNIKALTKSMKSRKGETQLQ